MSRTIRTVVAGGVLLAVASCGTAADTTPVVSTPTTAAPPAIRSTCEALGQAYGKNMSALAQSLSTLVADRTTPARAQGSLATFANAVVDATKASDDPQIRADGKQAADRMRATSADAKFFAAVKTRQDVDRTMGPTLTGWLSPIARHCS